MLSLRTDLSLEVQTTLDVAMLQRGELFIRQYGLHVRPDPTGRSGYRLFAGTQDFGVLVDVPVLEEDERDRSVASRTLENAIDAITYRAGEATVWAH